MPQPQGKSVMVLCYDDADHAGCRVTCCLHTCILIMVNCAPMLWSKRQNVVETSTFGSEFIALKTAVEMVEGLCLYAWSSYGRSNKCLLQQQVCCEEFVSTLKKRHNVIAYHCCCKAQVLVLSELHLN
jgi:hypothetical protein